MSARARPGRPSRVSTREQRAIAREARRNGARSARAIALSAGVDIHPTTARTYLRNAGLKNLARPLVQKVTKRAKMKRLSWCREAKTTPESFWDTVIWSDETMICVTGTMVQ